MSAGYTNLRTVSYRDTIAELIARANQTHTRATGVQVFSPGDGMAYEDTEGFINPISPSLFDDATRQIAEASEALVATEEELEAAQVRIDETAELLGQLDEQSGQTAEEVAGVIDDMAADRLRLDAAEQELSGLAPRVGDVEGAVSASDAKAAQAVSDAARALQEAQQAREYAEGLDPSTGDGSYSEAMQAAQAAARDALAAMERANLAVTSASGKSSVRNATSAPQGVGTAPGDTWFRWTAFPGGTVTGQWTWDGTEWRPVTLAHQVLSSVDLGKATVGMLHGSYLEAGSVSADRVLIGVGGNLAPDPRFQSPAAWGGSTYVQPSTPGRLAKGAFVVPASTSSSSSRGAYVSERIPAPPSGRVLLSVWAKTDSDAAAYGVRIYIRGYAQDGSWAFADPGSIYNSETIPADTWVQLRGEVELPADSATMAVGLYVQPLYTGQVTFSDLSVQPLTSGELILDGTVTASKVNAESVAGALGQFIKVQAQNVEVTDTLAARVLSAATAQAAEAFITDHLVVGTGDDRTVLEVLGTAVVNDLNFRGTMRGRDAILDGTLDVEQLNVTGDMAAEIGRFMRTETKKLIVTESAVMQHVTAIEGVITPKITASEARMGELIAEKASINDIEGGSLTLTGHFRSGAVGMPGVIIPQNYTTQAGMEQLGVWLAPDGKAPSLGSEWGRTAGMWLDSASNVTGSNNTSPLFIRGQSGAGVRVMGGLSVGNSAGDGFITPAGDGDMIINARLGNISLGAGKQITLSGSTGLVLRTNGYHTLQNASGSAYPRGTGGNSYVNLLMDSSNGRIYRSTSARRYKTDIEPFTPDPKWLDMPVVTYVDAEDTVKKRTQIGTIAEDAVEYGADALVAYGPNGELEDYYYSREVVVLRYFLREHRDKIAALEARIEELESALL